MVGVDLASSGIATILVAGAARRLCADCDRRNSTNSSRLRIRAQGDSRINEEFAARGMRVWPSIRFAPARDHVARRSRRKH